MSRGGRRRRWIFRHEAAVSCPGGRWGRRRTRVTECWSMLSAEELYTTLLADDASTVRPGASGRAVFTVQDREHVVRWEVRHNAVWRRGRTFLLCSQCGLRCTRLYLPLEQSWLACRRCWGLTYQSRTLQNYKNSIWGRGALAQMFGTTQRDWALLYTDERRKARRERPRQRWAERRRFTCRPEGANR